MGRGLAYCTFVNLQVAFVTSATFCAFLQEIEVLRKQNIKLSEENGKLVGHKNHKQRIEYLVKLKKDNTKLQEVTMFSSKIKEGFSMTRWILITHDINQICAFLCVFKENEKLRTEISLMRENTGCPPLELNLWCLFEQSNLFFFFFFFKYKFMFFLP